MLARARREVGLEQGGLRELAVVVRDLLEVRPLGDRLHPPRHRDRLRPVLFLLVDRDQEAERRVLERRAVELGEQLLGAVEQSGAMEVLRELEHRRLALVRREVRAVEQVLVHPRRAVDLALAPEQAPEREVQVDRLRIDLDHLDERLDRLVRLLVQQEVEAAKIGQRQRARLAQQVLDVDARGDPAQREEQGRDRQQPPQLEIHRRGAEFQRSGPCERGSAAPASRRRPRRPREPARSCTLPVRGPPAVEAAAGGAARGATRLSWRARARRAASRAGEEPAARSRSRTRSAR